MDSRCGSACVNSSYSPPRRGGVDAPKAQTGWSDRQNIAPELTTPALRATPPLRGGECVLSTTELARHPDHIVVVADASLVECLNGIGHWAEQRLESHAVSA